MGQKKLIRFEEIRSFQNVFEYPENKKGQWKHFFKNDGPITLELACGKGEYTIGLARMYPNENFIGVDVKGNRIWRGAKTALDDSLDNVAFLRTQIDRIDEYFGSEEIAQIWITFPDSQLRISRIEKRLTHPKFLRKYQQFLQKDGSVHLKTDSPDLYNFTKEMIRLFELTTLEDRDDVYTDPQIKEELKIRTYYESLDIAGSKRVHYLHFLLDRSLPEEKDRILKEIIREQAVEGRR